MEKTCTSWSWMTRQWFAKRRQAILSTNSRVKVTVAADPLIAWAKDAKGTARRRHYRPRNAAHGRRDFHSKNHVGNAYAGCGLLPPAARGNELPACALEEGAVEVITKRKVGVREFLHESAVTLVDAVWSASQAQVRQRPRMAAVPRLTVDAVLPRKSKVRGPAVPNGLIAMGASTGGTEALRVFLTAMPTDCPPIVIVQHMPEVFTRAFAERLNKECAIEVEEARDGDRLQPGLALIAPGKIVNPCSSIAPPETSSSKLSMGRWFRAIVPVLTSSFARWHLPRAQRRLASS